MPKKQNSAPKYRRQKRKAGDLAFVGLCGRRFYLGRYDSSESTKEYRRVLAEWHAGGKQARVSQTAITVTQLLSKYWHSLKRLRSSACSSSVCCLVDLLRTFSIEL